MYTENKYKIIEIYLSDIYVKFVSACYIFLELFIYFDDKNI